ncbi:MAG: 2-amino-4-hydroxy-6-hydroxymethyldihydropteridine diphosphokinase [Burkholderiaceae bacterium]|nr:2-amino-4-hydroxy-6-hydroxymethyldihydropteridine diphosphokinase [Burkholderiaceae bacterium]
MSVLSYIGIGANLGDASTTVQQAIAKLAALPATALRAQSSLFRTTPIDSHGDDYINAVVCIATALDAHELLLALQAIEAEHGRERPYINAPRTLDLDILLYGDHRIESETLTVPHPRLTQRAFTLIPLLQLDPFISIPGKGSAHQFAPGVADQAITRIGA